MVFSIVCTHTTNIVFRTYELTHCYHFYIKYNIKDSDETKYFGGPGTALRLAFSSSFTNSTFLMLFTVYNNYSQTDNTHTYTHTHVRTHVHKNKIKIYLLFGTILTVHNEYLIF